MMMLKSFVQEDEDDEYEEENSLMEDTMGQTGNEEDGEASDDRILVGKKTHQVSLLPFLHEVLLTKELPLTAWLIKRNK